MTHSTRQAARHMIERAGARGQAMTNLKLHKLLYLAHGLMLAEHERPLLAEAFQAWKYGPVLESLYHDLKSYGPGPIKASDGFVRHWPTLPQAAVEERKAIDEVLAQCGSMSGGELISLTHHVKGPWHAAYKANSQSIEIDDERIKSYFKTIIVA